MRYLASFAFVSIASLAACGSSKSTEKKEDAPQDMADMKQDDSWMAARFGVDTCDAYLVHMASCRNAMPEEAKGAVDGGMKQVIAAWKSISLEDEATRSALASGCAQANDAAAGALGEVCPGVWPAPAPEPTPE